MPHDNHNIEARNKQLRYIANEITINYETVKNI